MESISEYMGRFLFNSLRKHLDSRVAVAQNARSVTRCSSDKREARAPVTSPGNCMHGIALSRQRLWIKAQLQQEHITELAELSQVHVAMRAPVVCLLLLLALAGGYRIVDEENSDNSENYSNRPIGMEFDTFKRVQDFVYPKMYEAVNTVNSLSNSRNITLGEISDNPSESSSDLQTKHASLGFGFSSAEHPPRPVNALHPPMSGSLLGLVCLIDPILVMTVLGFVFYLVNGILGLLGRVLVTGNMMSLMNNTTPSVNPIQRQSEVNASAMEWNSTLLKNLERILQLAIDMYEDKHSFSS